MSEEKKVVRVCLVLRFSPPSNLFVGFFKNLKIHQKNKLFERSMRA